jgi:hypothetical protein
VSVNEAMFRYQSASITDWYASVNPVQIGMSTSRHWGQAQQPQRTFRAEDAELVGPQFPERRRNQPRGNPSATLVFQVTELFR